jgi:hypothetical protein
MSYHGQTTRASEDGWLSAVFLARRSIFAKMGACVDLRLCRGEAVQRAPVTGAKESAMDKKIYESAQQARNAAARMRGYTGRRVRGVVVVGKHAEEKIGWVIECHVPGASRRSAPLYLREDGYVR